MVSPTTVHALGQAGNQTANRLALLVLKDKALAKIGKPVLAAAAVAAGFFLGRIGSNILANVMRLVFLAAGVFLAYKILTLQ